MEGWEPHLHWSFRQEHVLLPSLVLHSFPNFIVAGLSLTLLCLVERLVTFALEQHWIPRIFVRSRWQKALWRTFLYWVVTFLRLCYMLAAMTFQLGILLVIVNTAQLGFDQLANLQLQQQVTSLSSGQFLIECWKSGDELPRLKENDESRVSLIQSQHHTYPLNSVAGNQHTRPRSRSKPQDIFIHPADPNIARADALALQLGINDTEQSQENIYRKTGSAWEAGNGRLKARELLGHSRRSSVKEQKDEESFLIGGSDSESES